MNIYLSGFIALFISAISFAGGRGASETPSPFVRGGSEPVGVIAPPPYTRQGYVNYPWASINQSAVPCLIGKHDSSGMFGALGPWCSSLVSAVWFLSGVMVTTLTGIAVSESSTVLCLDSCYPNFDYAFTNCERLSNVIGNTQGALGFAALNTVAGAGALIGSVASNSKKYRKAYLQKPLNYYILGCDHNRCIEFYEKNHTILKAAREGRYIPDHSCASGAFILEHPVMIKDDENVYALACILRSARKCTPIANGRNVKLNDIISWTNLSTSQKERIISSWNAYIPRIPVY